MPHVLRTQRVTLIFFEDIDTGIRRSHAQIASGGSDEHKTFFAFDDDTFPGRAAILRHCHDDNYRYI